MNTDTLFPFPEWIEQRCDVGKPDYRAPTKAAPWKFVEDTGDSVSSTCNPNRIEGLRG